jgi:hypothetical protein
MHDHHYLGTNGNSTKQHYHNTTPTTPYTLQLTPTPETSSRLKTPTKSALKSSLRSPSTKTPSTISGTAKIPESFHTTAPSPLKSMKTLLTRKYSGKLRSPFSGHKATSDQPKKVRKGVRFFIVQYSFPFRILEVIAMNTRLRNLRVSFQTSARRADPNHQEVTISPTYHVFELDSHNNNFMVTILTLNIASRLNQETGGS